MNELLRRLLFLPPQASTISSSVDHLHYVVILTTIASAIGLSLLSLYWIVRYRRRESDDIEPPAESAPTTSLWVELGIAGLLFALFFAWWIVGFGQYLRMRVAPANTYDVYVTAKQWMWKFAYPEGAHSIAQLYVPAGRPIRLVMSSRDVIHSFYVPDFRLKQDVLPGRYTTLWFEAPTPGKHEILCAEYCGTNHSTMRAEVVVLSPEDFGRWLAGRGGDPTTAAPPDGDPAVVTSVGPGKPMSLERVGEQVAAQVGCLRCHTLDGTPHIGPTWAGVYGTQVPLADGTHVLADGEYLTESMMDPMVHIRAGFQPVMPSYLGRLQPAETAAIVELIKSLRDVQAPSPGVVPPSQQGLAPPGVTVMPRMQGDVRVGPNGPEVPQP
ncbi:MAG: cytochrome c oxidase subunit II [Polyangia bacterium]